LPTFERDTQVTVFLRPTQIETPKHANKSNRLNGLQTMTDDRLIVSIASEFLRATFYRATCLFSTICEFGNELAPLAIGVPNQKPIRISNLASISAFDG
jgi:hypothetical protein